MLFFFDLLPPWKKRVQELFPTNPDPVNILGRTASDFVNLYLSFWGILNLQISDAWIFRFPEIYKAGIGLDLGLSRSLASLGRYWAGLGRVPVQDQAASKADGEGGDRGVEDETTVLEGMFSWWSAWSMIWPPQFLYFSAHGKNC